MPAFYKQFRASTTDLKVLKAISLGALIALSASNAAYARSYTKADLEKLVAAESNSDANYRASKVCHAVYVFIAVNTKSKKRYDYYISAASSQLASQTNGISAILDDTNDDTDANARIVDKLVLDDFEKYYNHYKSVITLAELDKDLTTCMSNPKTKAQGTPPN